MAIRSEFYIKNNSVVKENFDIKWVMSLELSQKQQNIEILHQAIIDRFSVEPDRILEVSAKSKTEIFRLLSSFSIKLKINEHDYAFKSVYQSSKVSQDGLIDTLQHAEWLILDGYESKKRSQKVKLPIVELNLVEEYFLDPIKYYKGGN